MCKSKVRKKAVKGIYCTAAACMMLAMTACGEEENAETMETVLAETLAETSSSMMGQITSIEGDTITLALAAQPERNGDGSVKLPENGDTPQMPENEEAQQPPEGGEFQRGAPLTGEEKVLKVTDSTIYTINGENGALSDLKVNDMVTIILQEDEVTSVIVNAIMHKDIQGKEERAAY